MDPKAYSTRWHSFDSQLRENATVYFVGKSVRAISHLCVQQQEPIPEAMREFRAEPPLDPKKAGIALEKPLEEAPRSGYCQHCNILWVAEDLNG